MNGLLEKLTTPRIASMFRPRIGAVGRQWIERLGQERAADVMAIPGNERLSIIPNNFLLGSDFSNFAAEFTARGVKEVHRHSLYAMKAYGTGGHTQLILFDQNTGTATQRQADTNMQFSGAMAGNEAMVICGIRVYPLPAAADYNAAAAGTAVAFGQWGEVLMRNCWLELIISEKPYSFGGPLTQYPTGFGPGSQVSGAATVLRNVNWFQNGAPVNQAIWEVDPPLVVMPSRAVRVTANWVTALAVTTAGKFGVYLDGYRIRAVQ